MEHNDQPDEIWKNVYCSKNYLISNKGRVRSVPRKRVVKGKILATHLVQGYPSITIDGISRRIHKLLCEAFYGPANGLYVNHKNGIKTDNRLENLEYVTQKENNQHAFRTGLINNTGENHGMAKLSDSDTLLIKDLLLSGVAGNEIAKRFNVSKATISMIKHGNRRNTTKGIRVC